MFDRVIFVCALLLFSTLHCMAQEVRVQGRFLEDSIKIGIVFPYSLTASYPKNKTVVFPDSTFSFAPFEIDQKKYFPTKSTTSTSYDSVVYFLTSFEIDSIQTLQLPVFIVEGNDSTAIYAQKDSVFLKHLVAQVPDSVSIEKLPLKTNTAYQTVKWLLNYPFLLISGGVLLLISIIVWIVFGKRIKQYFVLRKLKKNHQKFLKEFQRAVEKLQSGYSTQQAEATLLLWKQYMERLLASPITKYTSKEIFNLVKDQSLADALRQIDKTIYRESKELKTEPLIELQRFTEQQFTNKVHEVRNG